MSAAHFVIAAALNGWIDQRDGAIDWLLAGGDPAQDHGCKAFIKHMEAIIMGRGS